jgi:hypothetical protein
MASEPVAKGTNLLMIMRERYIKITTCTRGKEAPWLIFEVIPFPSHRSFLPVVYLLCYIIGSVAVMATTEVRWDVDTVLSGTYYRRFGRWRFLNVRVKNYFF